jgi:hypothetical protein
MQLYKMLKERKNHFNVVMLCNLIGRQYNFLSDSDKLDCINNFTNASDPHCWSPVTKIMDMEEKEQLQRKLNVTTIHDNILEHLRNLEQQPSLNNLYTLVSKCFSF